MWVKPRIPYEDLEKHFTKPSDWAPNTPNQKGAISAGFFGRYKKMPRKMKKLGKKWDTLNHIDYCVGLWYRQHCLNPDYNRFLIKLICTS